MTSLPVLDSAHFVALVARLPVGVAVYRLDDADAPASLRLVYGNARAEAIIGIDLEAAVGRPIGEIMPDLAGTDVPRLCAVVALTGEERDLGEVEYGDERSRRRTLAMRAFPLPDRCVGIEFEDVSDQKELRLLRTMRDALETSEERLRLATESAAIGTWDFDLVGGRLAWDDRCKAIYGLTPDDYVDYGVFLGLIHPDDRARTDEVVQRALEPAGTGRYDVEYRVVLPDGSERWVHHTGKGLFEGEGADRRAVRLIGTARDVTEQKQAQKRLEAAQRELIETNRHLEERVAERTARLEAFADDLKLLHRITTAEHDDRAALVRSFLEAGCTMFGLPVGVLGTLVEDDGAWHYAPEAVVGTETELQPGGLVPVDTLFVSAVLGREDTVAIEDAAADEGWCAHPAHTQRGYRAFLGTPVWLEDRLYGAVHFLGHEPPAGGLAAHDRELIEVLAELIGWTLRLERAQQARTSDDRIYRSLVDTVSDAILLVDADSRILMSNPAAHEMLGIDPEPPLKRLTGAHRWPVFDDRGRPIAEDDLPERRALRTGEAVSGAIKGVRRPDGATTWLSVNVRPLDLDEDGVPEVVVASFSDITPQRNALASLEHKTRQLEDAQALAHLGYWHYDVAHDAVHWSDELYAIFGLASSEEPVTFERYAGLLHPEDREEVEAVVRASLQSGEPYEVNHRIVRPDGAVRWIHSHGEVVVDEAGAPVRLQGTAQDVTERTRAQQRLERYAADLEAAQNELQSNTAFLQNTLDALSAHVAILDEEGTVIAVNEAWRRFAGENGYEDPAAGLGANYLEVSAAPGSEAVAEGLRRLLAGEADAFTAEYPCHGPHRQRWFLLRVTRFVSPEGVRLVTAHEDVTEMKRAQEVLRQNAADLAERNEELQQFAYVASHDLQEPLRMVTSFLQLLERRYTDALDDTARQYIEFAVDGARRMQALIKDLLAYSRVGTHGQGFGPVDMNGVLETVQRDLGPALEDVEGRVEAGELPTVHGDATQLHQLFLNLIGNAVKFRRPGAPPRLRIAAARATVDGRPGWRFTVADNGIGIEPQYADRVFQVFQRLHTREEYEGTGIGLAIAKKIVERHGGEIGFEPTPGGGTTFYFTLPGAPSSSVPLT